MKNKLTDLNDHLFAQVERLSDESLAGEKLAQEIHRAKANTGVAQEIICNARLALDAHQAMVGVRGRKAPPMLGVDEQ